MTPNTDEPRSRGTFVVVLDSEALSVLAAPRERGTSAKRAQAVLHAIAEHGGRVVVPAPVLAETNRSEARRTSVDRIVRRFAVVPTDARIATQAGRLLAACGLASEHAIDAFVVATAAAAGNSVILTVDDDLRVLANRSPSVRVSDIARPWSAPPRRRSPEASK